MAHEINKPSVRTYYIARNADGSVLHQGVTEPNQVTTTGQPVMDVATDRDAHLANAAPFRDRFDPVPVEGEDVDIDHVYRTGRGVAMAKVRHVRDRRAVEDDPDRWSVRPASE